MSKLTVTCLGFKPLQKNTLQGFAKLRIAELCLTIHEVAIHQKGGKAWAQLPSRPWIKDGVAVTDGQGKVQYMLLMEFDRQEVRDAFSRAAINAVIDFAPSALALQEAM